MLNDSVKQAQENMSDLPEWLATLKGKACQEFCEQGLPGTRVEEWKYTNTHSLAQCQFKTAKTIVSKTTKELIKAHRIADASHELVFINGVFSDSLSRTSTVPGLTISRLAELPDQSSLSFEQMSVPSSLEDLNLALLTDGISIHTQTGLVLKGPIHILDMVDEDGLAVASRHQMTLGKLSELAIIQTNLCTSKAAFCGSHVQVICGDGSKLERVIIESQSGDSYRFSQTVAHVGRDASYSSHCFDGGSLLSRHETCVFLTNEGAECAINGLAILKDDVHTDHHNWIEHPQPHGTSTSTYKGVVADSGVFVFDGMVHVHRDAQKTDSSLYNHNLLLSDNATINTKPDLQIYADDVKCAHGSTVGQIDQSKVNYLRSRGISPHEARTMLTTAFAKEIVESISDVTAKSHVLNHVEAKLTEVCSQQHS